VSKIQIISRDPFKHIVKKLRDNGELSAYVEDSGNSRYKISTGNQEVQEALDGVNGVSYSEYDFSYSLNNRVNVEQVTNYNAVLSFEALQSQPEGNLKSVYQLSETQLIELENDFKNESYDILTGDIDALILPSDMAISLSENLDRTQIYRAKDYFPFRVDFRFTDTDNSFYNLLIKHEAYELMVEMFHRIPFPSEQISVDNYGNELFSLETGKVLSEAEEFSGFSTITIPDTVFEQLSWLPTFDNLEAALLESHIKNFINNNAPTYSSMVFGDQQSNFQIICYKIEKYVLGQNRPVQTFYVPASDSNRDFSDTQVYFGKEYTYTVDAIGIALSSNYQYNVVTPTGVDSVVTITEVPSAKFFKFRLLNQNVIISGIAPTVPEVSFLNRSNEEARMRFYFEPSIHEERANFLPILESDTESMINAKIDNEEKIIFRLNKDPLTYQMFKLNNKPKSYDDFANALAVDIVGSDISSSETYEMYLTPNRKFYFTFRAKNGFNLFSNPTPIYEVELIQDADETRVSVKTIDLTENTMMRTKTFGRFLRIYPSFEQVTIRDYSEVFEGLELDDQTSVVQQAFTFNNKQYFVGDTDNPIWGKKIKFRVRSRNTGKMVDINVDFVLEKVESEADF
tara:strand:+ start:380 stop:2260 length:1881 start_codon:yes stop_codon:yes gene_type:complete